jgi:hypothetical protein
VKCHLSHHLVSPNLGLRERACEPDPDTPRVIQWVVEQIVDLTDPERVATALIDSAWRHDWRLSRRRKSRTTTLLSTLKSLAA